MCMLRCDACEAGPTAISRTGDADMIWILTVSTAACTAWIVEWAQRHCEQWAQRRDEAL
jgi:hypothetical protein